jgi:hypothetical protein
MILGLEAENFGSDVLDGVKKFTVAGQKERGIGAAEFDCNFGGSLGRGEGVRWDSRRLTGWDAGGGLHLAVAGKDVGLEIQTACGA